MDDPIFKSKYQKYKYKVKVWEKSFKKLNGRIPSKHDIREAPVLIRDAYKMYYKLKSSFLEDTLSEIFDEDGFDLSLNSSQLDSSQSINDLSSSLIDLSPQNIDRPETCGSLSAMISLPDISQLTTNCSIDFSNLNELSSTSLTNLRNTDGNHIISGFEAEQSLAINENAWGKNFNKKPTQKPLKHSASLTSSQDLRKAMTEKLFQNSNFTKRNPRKSMARSISSQSSSNLCSQNNSQTKETLPDLETILLEKSRKNLQENVQAKIIGESKNQLTNSNIDFGWLNRCNQLNGLESTSESLSPTVTISNNNLKTSEPKYGLSNIKLVETIGFSQKESKPKAKHIYDHQADGSDHSDDVIENSEDESAMVLLSRTRHVQKKRRIEPMIKMSVTQPDPIESIKLLTTTNIQTTEKKEPVVTEKNETKPRKGKKQKVTRNVLTFPTVRKSTRKTKSNFLQYNENQSDDSDVDPFINADDSNSDVDYTVDNVGHKLNSSTEMSPPMKNSRSTCIADALNTKVKKKSKKELSVLDKPTIDVDQETEDYTIEFGVEAVKYVPRININVLKQNSEVFEKFVNAINPNTITSSNHQSKIDSPLTKRDIERQKIEKKIATGSLNENFVRINIQKKKFSRGHRTMNFSKYKKGVWRKNKAAAALSGPEMDMRGCDGGFLVCFSCGEMGHFAQNCKIQGDRLAPLTTEIEKSDFATLDEVEEMALNRVLWVHANKPNSLPGSSNLTWKSADNPVENNQEQIKDVRDINNTEEHASINSEITLRAPAQYIGHTIPEAFLKKAGMFDFNVENSDAVQPLYEPNANGDFNDIPDEVYEALQMFGHTKFRKGQDRAIMRILSGQSTLVTLSTGSGKSLCYQLPAYLYRKRRKCITLVISPLVSLMEDQVHDVPYFLNAQCLHTNQTKTVRNKIMEAIKSGIVDVLLVSPEAIVAGEKSTGFGSLLRELPPIAFVCIDEAHCMSQWSHNFRPSYLMICRVLKEKLKIRTMLGLTATATVATRESIVNHLSIPDGLSGVISDIPLPDNLLLTVSKDENRDIALIHLLKDDKFAKFQSIIVYCTRRDECERLAKYIRTCFQDEEQRLALHPETSRKRKRTKHIVEFYHAGMVASRRKKIQNDFMRGDLKIVIATIAFGMGINKSDIRAVIHYNMPMTFEGYVQECNDLVELRRHIYANSIDRHAIRKLLQKIFVPCACKENMKQPEHQSEINFIQNMSWSDDINDEMVDTTNKDYMRICPGHEVSFSIESTIHELDIPEENIATLLCYMELHEQRYIQVLSKAYSMCKVVSYGGAKSIKIAAKTCPPLAMAIALDLKKGISHSESTIIEFPVIEIAAAIGWDSGIVKHQLKQLEWTSVNEMPKRSTLSVEFTNLAFRVRSPGDLSDDTLDETLELLHSRVLAQEKTQLIQLQNIFNGLSEKSFNSYSACIENTVANDRSNEIKQLIRDYFQREHINLNAEILDTANSQDSVPPEQIISDIRTMINRYPENNFTGRSLARIFHGVSSPVYPALIWSRCKYWRAHTKFDFNKIVLLANLEIVKSRT